MQDFTGSKWRCTGTKKVLNTEQWWQPRYVEKAEYRMTRSYLEYLKNKRVIELKQELAVMRTKLEYQQRTYGEVDEIDFNEYVAKLAEYQKA